MPRPARYSDSLPATVRRYFHLTQLELAVYLGVSPELVKHLEAGRRQLSAALLPRLLPLVQRLPPEPAAVPFDLTALPAAAAAPDPGPLAARLDYCQHQAARLRRQLRPLAQLATYATRWQLALPPLLAATAPAPGQQPGQPHRWLLRRQEAATAHLDSTASARHHLLRLQAEALETEAAALAALLAQAPAPAPAGS